MALKRISIELNRNIGWPPFHLLFHRVSQSRSEWTLTRSQIPVGVSGWSTSESCREPLFGYRLA